jgi:hypothetical protein
MIDATDCAHAKHEPSSIAETRTPSTNLIIGTPLTSRANQHAEPTIPKGHYFENDPKSMLFFFLPCFPSGGVDWIVAHSQSLSHGENLLHLDTFASNTNSDHRA